MSKKDESQFETKYKSLKENYDSLVELTKNEIDSISQEINNSVTIIKTNKYLLSVAAASTIVTFLPYTLEKVFKLLKPISEYLFTKRNQTEESGAVAINYSLIIGGSAILIYLFITPSFFGRITSFRINKKQSNYIICSFVGVYLMLGYILYLLQYNLIEYYDVIIRLFQFYLIFPLSFIVLLLLFIFGASIFIFPFKKKLNKYTYSTNERIELSLRFLNVLTELKEVHQLNFISKKIKNKIIHNLSKASTIIKNYPESFPKNMITDELISIFTLSSNYINKIIIDFKTKAENGTNDLKSEIVKCTNIALKGNLLDLPKLQVTNAQVRTPKTIKIFQYLLLSLYLTMPILLVYLLNISFHVTFTEFHQSLLKILYIIWAFVGIFTNPFVFNTENRELIRDIIKSLFGRS